MGIRDSRGWVTDSTEYYIWLDGKVAQMRLNGTSRTNIKANYYGRGESRHTGTESYHKTDFYYTKDHLGSIYEVCDSSAATVAGYDYTPFGERSERFTGSFDCDFGYTGHYHHETSGLVLTWYRAYDPGLGRWLSVDPIGENGGINLYGYVDNQPGMAEDPLGLFNPTKFLAACGNAANSARLTASGLGKMGIGAILAPTVETGIGGAASAGSFAWGVWNIKSALTNGERALLLARESAVEPASNACARNLLGVAPFGEEFDDPHEPSPWAVVKDKIKNAVNNPIDFLSEIGTLSF